MVSGTQDNPSLIKYNFYLLSPVFIAQVLVGPGKQLK